MKTATPKKQAKKFLFSNSDSFSNEKGIELEEQLRELDKEGEGDKIWNDLLSKPIPPQILAMEKQAIKDFKQGKSIKLP